MEKNLPYLYIYDRLNNTDRQLTVYSMVASDSTSPMRGSPTLKLAEPPMVYPDWKLTEISLVRCFSNLKLYFCALAVSLENSVSSDTTSGLRVKGVGGGESINLELSIQFGSIKVYIMMAKVAFIKTKTKNF